MMSLSLISPLLAQPEAFFLVSLVKPILFALILLIWGRVVVMLDRDAALHALPRSLWGSAHLAGGALGFLLILWVPIFILGVLLGGIVFIIEIGLYVTVRNGRVKSDQRWAFNLQTLRSLDFGLSGRLSDLAEQRAAKAATFCFVVKGDPLPIPDEDTLEHQAHTILENAVRFALPRGGDRIDWNVEPEKGTVSVRIDGLHYPMDPLPAATALAVVDYIKVAAKLDVGDRRKKQTGKVQVRVSEFGDHSLSVVTAGSTKGLTMSLGIDGAENAQLTVAELGLLERQKTRLKELNENKGGVVIVSGPAGQGVTTTLYALARQHDPYTEAIVAYEDATFYDLEGVSHEPISATTTPEEINNRLLAMLRTEPAVILLSRIADQRTAKIIAEHAKETRFYLPMPRPSAMAALKAWIKVVGDPRLAAESVRGVVSQRLIRKLCPTCRVAYQPDPAVLKKMNLSPDRVRQMFRATGKLVDPKKGEQVCPVCVGMGYRGRTAVFEVMKLDAQAQALAASGDFDGLRQHLRKQKTLYLQEAALSHVVDGLTDVREVQRALSEGAEA